MYTYKSDRENFGDHFDALKPESVKPWLRLV
jgi:hypothetical protein